MSTMPKKKSKKAVVKRFKKTATGEVKRRGAGRRHLLIAKTSKAKRSLRKGSVLSQAEKKRVASLF